jgi:putative chitinase
MNPLTPEQVALVCRHLKRDRLMQLYPHLVAAMGEFDVTTPLRQAAFLAQVAHESGEFRWFAEIGGAAKRYAPWYGRGAIQLTWKANYEACGKALGLDLVRDPNLVATDSVAFRAAGWFWRAHKLNELADAEDFLRITKVINGGLTHLAQRFAYYEAAKRALGC